MNDPIDPIQAMAWNRRGVRHGGLNDLLEFAAMADLNDQTKLRLVLNHVATDASEEHIKACVAMISENVNWDEITKSLIEEIGVSAEIISILYGVAKSQAVAPKLIDHIEAGNPWSVEMLVGAVRTPSGFSYWSTHHNAPNFLRQVVLMRCDDPLGTSTAASLSRRDDHRIEIECPELDRVASSSDFIMPNMVVLTHFIRT